MDDHQFIHPVYAECDCDNRPTYVGNKQPVLADISKMIEENTQNMSMFNILIELYPEYNAKHNYSASNHHALAKNNYTNNRDT